jgi:hypothetical protein
MRYVKAARLVPQKVRTLAIAQAKIEVMFEFGPQAFQPIRNLHPCRIGNLCVQYLARGFVDTAAHFAHGVSAHHDALFGGRAPSFRNDTRASGGVQKFIFNERPEPAEKIGVQPWFARLKSSDGRNIHLRHHCCDTARTSELIAAAVIASTAVTDAVYVMFNPAVTARHPSPAASKNALWQLLSAFAVISCSGNSIYVLFAATGSWIGAYFSVRWLDRSDSRTTPGGAAALGNPPA